MSRWLTDEDQREILEGRRADQEKKDAAAVASARWAHVIEPVMACLQARLVDPKGLYHEIQPAWSAAGVTYPEKISFSKGHRTLITVDAAGKIVNAGLGEKTATAVKSIIEEALKAQ